jgi:hypothetical protein
LAPQRTLEMPDSRTGSIDIPTSSVTSTSRVTRNYDFESAISNVSDLYIASTVHSTLRNALGLGVEGSTCSVGDVFKKRGESGVSWGGSL